MSTRHYRKAAALALVAAVGLSAAACSSSKASSAPGHTTITVDCPPAKTADGGADLKNWNADVAAFEKANPSITVLSVSVGAQCDNPPDFTARLAGNTETNVYYGYMTDTSQVLQQGQAMDISSYVTALPEWSQMSDLVKAPFTVGGKVYGIGYAGYTMGLVYNTKIFAKAGITTPPVTWDDVAKDAKIISTMDPTIAGYSDYSAQNTGGWHFTAELYSQGGKMVSDDGKTATFNSPEGKQVLTNLHNMRFGDNSMGSKQLLGWGDLLGNAGAGKVGMFIGAPDTIPAIQATFKGQTADWAMTAMPGQTGHGVGTLGGGSGAFFKTGDTPDQIKAGLKWIEYEYLTPGQGQFNFVNAKANGQAVGLPEPIIFNQGTPLQAALDKAKAASATVSLDQFKDFVANPVPIVVEPPMAQQIYAEIDKVMSAVLTQPNANIDALLATATTAVNTILAGTGS
jgi:multiple sugar transport system substrate-binding protein